MRRVVDTKDYIDITFNLADSGRTESLEAVEADVYAFCNLLFLQKGMYTGMLDMGIDIETIKHKIDINYNIDKIKSDINTQVKKYLPSADILITKLSVDAYGLITYDLIIRGEYKATMASKDNNMVSISIMELIK